jgi:hypothetical protein
MTSAESLQQIPQHRPQSGPSLPAGRHGSVNSHLFNAAKLELFVGHDLY